MCVYELFLLSFKIKWNLTFNDYFPVLIEIAIAMHTEPSFFFHSIWMLMAEGKISSCNNGI